MGLFTIAIKTSLGLKSNIDKYLIFSFVLSVNESYSYNKLKLDKDIFSYPSIVETMTCIKN
jgi:hypothetical protein